MNIEEKLKGLQPQAPTLDRDAMMVEIGRRSVHRLYFLKCCASILAITQLCTIFFLVWPTRVPTYVPMNNPSDDSKEPAPVVLPNEYEEPSEFSYIRLLREWDTNKSHYNPNQGSGYSEPENVNPPVRVRDYSLFF